MLEAFYTSTTSRLNVSHNHNPEFHFKSTVRNTGPPEL